MDVRFQCMYASGQKDALFSISDSDRKVHAACSWSRIFFFGGFD